MEKKQQQFSIWYFLAIMFVILAIQNYFFAPHTANLAYSEFKVLLKAGKVSDPTIEPKNWSAPCGPFLFSVA